MLADIFKVGILNAYFELCTMHQINIAIKIIIIINEVILWVKGSTYSVSFNHQKFTNPINFIDKDTEFQNDYKIWQRLIGSKWQCGHQAPGCLKENPVLFFFFFQFFWD